jgi:hypothetical protein
MEVESVMEVGRLYAEDGADFRALPLKCKCRRPESSAYRAGLELLDVGLMPYDCLGKKNLHCSPLKL